MMTGIICAWKVTRLAPEAEVQIFDYFSNEKDANTLADSVHADRKARVECMRDPKGILSLPRFSEYHTVHGEGFVPLGVVSSVINNGSVLYCLPENLEIAKAHAEKNAQSHNECMMAYERFH